MELQRIQQQQQQHKRSDERERCECQRQRRALLQLQRICVDQWRRLFRSELVWRIDERRLHRSILLELQRIRQQQHKRSDQSERCECQRLRRALLQLHLICVDRWRRLFWSELVWWIDERRLHRSILLELQRIRQQQHKRSDECERCECQRQRRALLQLHRICVDQWRQLFRSEIVWRIDERRLHRSILLEYQRIRQQQHKRSDERERCDCQRQRRALLQLQRICVDQ